MKARCLAVLVVSATLLLGVAPAFAHGHGHGGHASIWIGPLWAPGFWWGPAYYPPPPRTVIIERSPEVYVQPAPQQESSGYWYYCRDARAYYPYVKECPGGWARVSPTPPPERGE